MHIQDLTSYLDELLDVQAFSDPSYNGVQVAGPEEIKKIATACTASLEAIDEAVENGCDALLVHHGMFWKGASPCLVGNYFQRVQSLIDGKLNLLAYHLPMDAHMEYGNNAVLARLLKADNIDYVEPGDKRSIAVRARLSKPLTPTEVSAILSYYLDTKVAVIGALSDELRLDDFVICSGAGSSFLDNNKCPNFQALITGEYQEQTYHMAVETGTLVFVVGHHASEQLAIGNLGEHLADKFNLKLHKTHFTYEKDLVTFVHKGR